jgi:hypothetical protein
MVMHWIRKPSGNPVINKQINWKSNEECSFIALLHKIFENYKGEEKDSGEPWQSLPKSSDKSELSAM